MLRADLLGEVAEVDAGVGLRLGRGGGGRGGRRLGREHRRREQAGQEEHVEGDIHGGSEVHQEAWPRGGFVQ